MISVLLPTTGRPDMAAAMVESLRATTQGHEVEVLAEIDADADTYNRLAALPGSPDFRICLHLFPSYRGNSAAWNEALRRSKGELILFGADDLEFTEGWLEAALGARESLPDQWGMVGLNDGHHGAELATHYLLDRRFVIEVLGGVVAWPFYPHSFNDLETNDRARAAGRYVWAEAALVRHSHWIFGDRPQDATDTRTLGDHPEARATYERRKAAGFPTDYDPVITA